MANRSAIETIKGYFYQFDHSIKRILESMNPDDSVTVEGVEDVDLKSVNEETAIQCKYYAKTEYNHSLIAKPIRLMLNHFMEEKRKLKPHIRYSLYGHYKSGQSKLVLPISLDDFKNFFLTYKENKTIQYHHRNIGALDKDIEDFMSQLDIDIRAQEYEEQLQSILNLLKTTFSCTAFDAENYYYNNALNIVRELAITGDIKRRLITKSDFLKKIDSKAILFNEWFLEYKDQKQFFKELKREYFTSLNTSPFDRFFLVEIDQNKYSRSELKDLIHTISKKWSKISSREKSPFCPYILIQNIDPEELIDIKKELQTEEFIFIDGYSFHGSEFDIKSILKTPDSHNGITLKFLNEFNDLEQILKESRKTKEVYQFYLNTPFYSNDSKSIKHVKIQIKQLKNIKEII